MTIISGITHENWKQKQKKIHLSTGISMSYMEAGNTEGKILQRLRRLSVCCLREFF